MTPKCYSYIRFSTPEQHKGDSLRRQLKLSEEYARDKGYELDESLKDFGLSAYNGEHRNRGALGRFFVLINEGKIPRGSTLLVESLDRLSREQIFDALEQFMAIIRAGVKVVTLTDRMEYSQESINENFTKLMFSLSVMSRAHEESQIKAMRLKAAWEAKRDNINHIKLTAICPEWMEISADRSSFRIIPERADIIRRIYRERLAGNSTRLIARGLNTQNAWVPRKRREGGTGGWRESYIQKILRTPAVIGEYQPCKISKVDGLRKRTPVGEPIRGYFPAVVPEEIFYSVQQKLEQDRQRAGNGGGRTGIINNLFGHLAKCGYCGSPMAFVDKGPLPKGGKYLVCDAARRGLPGCKRYLVRYEEFEDVALKFCRNLDPVNILPNHEERKSLLKSLEEQANAISGQIKSNEKKINNLVDSIATTNEQGIRRILETRVAEALREQDELKEKYKKIYQNLEQEARRDVDTRVHLNSMREFLAVLKKTQGDELVNLRRRLRDELRQIIKHIEMYPVGRPRVTEEYIEKWEVAMLDMYPEWASDGTLVREKNKLRGKIDNRELRYFTIFFKGGSIRALSPTSKNVIQLDFDKEGRRFGYLIRGKNGEDILYYPENH